MKKLLVSDLDGTIVNGAAGYSKTTEDAINRWREAGNYFAIATGRLVSSASIYSKALDCNGYLVCCSGAAIYRDGELVKEEVVSESIAERIWSVCSKNAVYAQIYSGDHLFANFDGPFLEFYREMNASLPESLRMPLTVLGDFDASVLPYGIHKTSFVFTNNYERDLILKELKGITGINRFMSLAYLCDIVNEKADKGNAALYLKESLGAQKVYGIGDNENDIELLRKTDHSCAMGSAPEHVQKYADMVTGNITEEGFARYVNFLLENEDLQV